MPAAQRHPLNHDADDMRAIAAARVRPLADLLSYWRERYHAGQQRVAHAVENAELGWQRHRYVGCIAVEKKERDVAQDTLHYLAKLDQIERGSA